MPLLRDGRITQDTWIALNDADELPGESDVIVSFERLGKDAGLLAARKGGRTGVAIENNVDPGELAPHLAHLDLIALDFPAFTDGRAYSQARRLRSEFGYKGELRATGDVLADQAGFLIQVGFDTFEVENGALLDTWNQAARSMTLAYQRGYDGDRKTRKPARTPPLVVRFAGDSGDGIQLAGFEFAKSSAEANSDFMTFPDYPAEIRAPAGTLFGVSAFQIQFGADEVLTPGDKADVLVAFNPAALATNLQNLKPGGVLIVDESHFDTRGLKKAKLESSPLEDGTLDGYQLITVDVVKRTLEALQSLELGRKPALRARNFWVLGLVYWMFGRPLEGTQDWLKEKFKKTPEVANANITALKAGHAYGETMEVSAFRALAAPRIAKHKGKSRIVSGAQAMALGLAAVAALGKRDIVYCSYPITPASALLHALARIKGGVRTFQAEDEIASISAALGASFAGSLGVTASSGPGLSLKTEALGLGIAVELPLIVIDVQRAGPSTGMPTKPEQSDLAMAIHGRHGEAPCPVLAPATPDECFWIMIEAARMAIAAMTPVIVLSDAYLANAASRWDVPDVDSIPDIDWPVHKPDDGEFQPYARDAQTLARPWVAPGTPGHAHRIGGLEKAQGSGHISYDPANHAEMVRIRAEKIARIAERIPPVELENGPQDAELLVIGWGSTHGSITQAVKELNAAGKRVAHVHLRHLWPLPRGLDDLLKRFPRAVTAELNSGQLCAILRSEYLAPLECISQINGQPFYVSDLKSHIIERLEAPRP